MPAQTQHFTMIEKAVETGSNTDSLPPTTVLGSVAESNNPKHSRCTFTGHHVKRVWVKMATFSSVFLSLWLV